MPRQELFSDCLRQRERGGTGGGTKSRDDIGGRDRFRTYDHFDNISNTGSSGSLKLTYISHSRASFHKLYRIRYNTPILDRYRPPWIPVLHCVPDSTNSVVATGIPED